MNDDNRILLTKKKKTIIFLFFFQKKREVLPHLDGVEVDQHIVKLFQQEEARGHALAAGNRIFACVGRKESESTITPRTKHM